MATLTFRFQPPLKFLEELKKAEATYASTPRSGPIELKLPIASITEKPELFQPREFHYGTKPVDYDHVSKLQSELSIRGSLDPIHVIKLGDEFICLDGHHRLEAYRRSRKRTIRCVRYKGPSVREAIDATLRRNSYHQLPLSNSDRQEAAWRQVVSDWGSIQGISKGCGISTSQVSRMRKVKASWNETGPTGTRMNQKVPGGPQSVCWYKAQSVYNNQDEKGEVDIEEEAQRLARNLHSRMSNKLRRDPTISARALEIHCPEVIEYIKEAAVDASKPPKERFAL